MNLTMRLTRAGVELGQRFAQEIHSHASPLFDRTRHRRNPVTEERPNLSRLPTMRALLETSLRDDVLPFWARHSPDETHGGFITHLDRHGRRFGPSDKYLVMQARLIWTMAAAHRHGLTSFGYLDLAAHGVQFLLERMWDREHRGFVWATSREGQPIDGHKTLYGHAFAIYALAEYALAAGDSSALTWAETTLGVLQQRASDGDLGFRERFARDWTALPGREIGRKTTDAHLHLMEAMTTLFEASSSRAHAATLRQLVNLLLTNAIDPRHHHLREDFNRSWQPRGSWRRPNVTSYGHEAETAWLLLRAVDVLGDSRDEMQQSVLGLIDHAVQYGFDHLRGGLARYGPPAGDARYAVYLSQDRLVKHWWEQAEMLVATIEAYRWTGMPKYLEVFEKQFDWIWRHQIDHECGEWFGATTWREGRPLGFHKGDDWKCSYHTARAMMETARRLQEIGRPAFLAGETEPEALGGISDAREPIVVGR